MPVTYINALTSGSRINWTEGTVILGAPEGPNPNGTCERAGMRTPTQPTSPRLSRSPPIHKKRATGLSHASVMTNDGYTDFASVGVRLPNSVARANVRTSDPASRGEIAKTCREVAIRIRFFVLEAMNSTPPRSG